MLFANVMTKKCGVSVIVVYAPVVPTDGVCRDTDEFYLVTGTNRLDRR